ncbi:TIGR04255 family protein [Mycobacterium paraffinicum]|uniref:TIGR04255 family protein n=1 Tax=Mycobacterium paraffinicum TaxID=53378 RepID=A0ABP8F635_9MYCO|nr:TIGR04255 family protein [Mycobacterium paraffinicum]MCV7311269.1 TIGR04255 family protein [Mycobacterium paraffinicum]
MTDVAPRRKYPNPPIVEVICQVTFTEAVSWSAASPGLLYARIRDDYPAEPNAQTAIEASVDGENGQLQVKRGGLRFVYSNSDQNRRLVANEDNLSVNALPPYENWDSLATRFREALKAFRDEFGAFTPAAVSLRYINRVIVPGESVRPTDYFNVPVVMAHQPDSRTRAFVSRSESISAETSIETTVTFASVAHAVEGESAFMLDIDLSIPAPSDADVDQMVELATVLHKWENHEFESSITDACRKLFG